MIKINLLPYHETEKKVSQAKQIFVIVGSFIAFIACIAVLHLYMVARIVLLENNIRDSEQQITELKKIVGNIDEFKADKKNMENKIGLITKLEEGRTFPVNMLDQLASAVPTKELSLDSISQTETALSIEGKAKNTIAVANFMKSLETLAFIANVDLVSSKQDEFSGVKIQSFKLKCGIKKG
ncbi:MAG TPA: PilN domain-containing protein [Syntrophales bacterium]|nr:PilN domain-containing protein [Syntrophales bacterium]